MSAEQPAKEKDWRRLVADAQAGDRKAKEQLVEENSGLIHMVLKRFSRTNHDMEELFQVGAIGLVRAIDQFDLSTEYAFSTYAVPMIIGEIQRFLRDDGMLHVSRQIKENARKVFAVQEEWKRRQGRDLSVNELAEETGLSAEEIVLALDASRTVDSIYRPLGVKDGEEKNLTLADQLMDPQENDNRLIDRIAVHQMLEGLNANDRRLIELRYMEGLTQSETARRLGTNQVAVSRQEKKILLSLRKKYG